MMNCTDISKKVKDEIYSIRLKSSTRPNLSSCWKCFSEVVNDNGDILFGVACCNYCYKCILYKTKTDCGKVLDYGTKNLKDHTRNCSPDVASSSQFKITSVLKRKNQLLSKQDNQTILEVSRNFVAGSFLSFNTIENPQFINFSQEMIRIGAKYGNVTASEIIPGRKTISKSTVAQIIIIKQVISSRLEDPIQRDAFAFTTDLWTDNVMQRSYLDVSFFWISQEMDHDSGIDKELWSLKRAMYACKVFPKTKTSENIEF